MKLGRRKGSLLLLVFIVGLASVIVITAVAGITRMSAHQVGFLDKMRDAHSVAEYGFSQALSNLIYLPHACDNPSPDYNVFIATAQSVPGYTSAKYFNNCSHRDIPNISNCPYVVTTAAVTEGGKTYTEKLHSYVSVANVSAYFIAVNQNLTLAANTNASGANLYARDLLTFSGTGVQANRAEFYGSVWPSLTSGQWPGYANLSDNGGYPVKLAAPLLFPKVTQDNDNYWSDVSRAHNNAQTCNLSGLLLPPEYGDWSTNWTSVDPDGNTITDTYNHNINNDGGQNTAIHIYYCQGDASLTNITFVGQILVVSTGNIILHGDIRAFNPPAIGGDTAGRTAANTVGSGSMSINGSSTGSPLNYAHELVLIPGPSKDVIIAGDQTTTLPTQAHVGSDYIQTVQALVFTPNGSFSPSGSAQLCFRFTGSMVLGVDPLSFGTVYTGCDPNSRIYSYDTNLLNFPPPYMPSLSQIYNQFVEMDSSAGVFQ